VAVAAVPEQRPAADLELADLLVAGEDLEIERRLGPCQLEVRELAPHLVLADAARRAA
jgi:hypothetical protein